MASTELCGRPSSVVQALTVNGESAARTGTETKENNKAIQTGIAPKRSEKERFSMAQGIASGSWLMWGGRFKVDSE
jgi:hypothetical protein